jgi:hypothetical protein
VQEIWGVGEKNVNGEQVLRCRDELCRVASEFNGAEDF